MQQRDARATVGSARREGALTVPPLFVIAVGSLAISFMVFIAMVAGAACGSDGDGGPLTVAPATETPTGTPAEGTAPTTATATSPATGPTATPGKSATPAGGGNGGGTATTAANIVACGDILAPLNKQNALSANCAPGGLQVVPSCSATDGQQVLIGDARNALVEMIDAARKDGFSLGAVSSYRSYQDQVETYNYWVRTSGQDYADRTSARPGHSEHQLGTTADVSSPAAGCGLESLIGTREADWIAANSWKFGFVVSYPAGKEGVTGYAYEPWHIRYIGRGEASKVNASGLTLTEYLGKR